MCLPKADAQVLTTDWGLIVPAGAIIPRTLSNILRASNALQMPGRLVSVWQRARFIVPSLARVKDGRKKGTKLELCWIAPVWGPVLVSTGQRALT